MKTYATAALLAALSLPVFAAATYAREPGMSHGDMGGEDSSKAGRMMMMSGMCPMMMMSKHVEGSLAFLRTELDVTRSEAAAWEEFADAYREAKRAKMDGGMMEHGQAMKPLPDRIAQHVKMMEDHLAGLKKLQEPVANLYDALDPDQKRTADELIPMIVMCPMG